MAQDRWEGSNIPLTHDFLSLMLAVRRPGVTEAVHELLNRGLIGHNRGNIVVIDREGLIERANGLSTEYRNPNINDYLEAKPETNSG